MGSVQIVGTSRWRFHADINAILSAAEMSIVNKKWVLTNWDSNLYPKGYTIDDQRILLDGKELLGTLGPDFQLIWGVLSGGGDSIVDSSSLPYSETNKDLWNPFYEIQNEYADFEIVAWDSSYTLVSSRDDALLENIRSNIGENAVFYTDCLKPTREYYRGMTVNEMLNRSGLDVEYYSAEKKNDKNRMISILCSLGIDWNTVRTIVESGDYA